MSQKKRGDKKSAKWLRLAVGAAVLSGASGAILPGMAGAAEATVNGMSGDNGFYSQLEEKVSIPHDGWDEKWYFINGADSAGNTLLFENFTPDGYDIRFGGGYGNGTAVTGNTVKITNSSLQGMVTGGYSAGEDEVSGNVLTLGTGTTVVSGQSLQVFGGYTSSEADKIANNTVNVLVPIELEALKGGENKTYTAGANGNTLNVAAKNVKTNWFGSFEKVNFFLPSDIANGDTMLTINNGGNATDLSGVKVGVTALKDVNLEKGNTVNLIVNENGLNNLPTELTAIENKDIQLVTPDSLLSDKEYTFGLEANEKALVATVTNVNSVTGDEPAEQPSSADGDVVTVKDGDVLEVVYGGNAADAVTGKTVMMTGGQVNGSVYGGYTTGKDGKAENNTVNVNGGEVAGDVYGGYSEQGTAKGNTVTVNGKTNLTSGWLKVIGGFSGEKDAEVSDNTVNLVDVDGLSMGNLQGGSVVYKDATGAEQYDGASNVKNNTMNFVNTKNVTTHYFDGFNTVNFYLPKDVKANDTILTVTDGSVSVDNMNVGVAAPYGLDNLQEKESVNLIKNEGKISGTANLVKPSTEVSFLTPDNLVTDKEYTFTLATTDDALVATLDKVSEAGGENNNEVNNEANNISGSDSGDADTIRKSQRLKSLVETQAAAVTVLNSGADLLTGAGFNQAKAAADTSAGKFAPFAAMGGSNLRADSGSHVDTKGYGINVGFAREIKKGSKTYLFAPVVEYGRGSYDSYQDNGLKADGKSSFWGVGMMGRQTNNHGLYVEGSLRAGKVKSDYNGQLSRVTHASYDTDNDYWAGHLGCGMVKKFKGGNSLDSYVKYFYSHQDGDKVKVNINGGALIDEITFANVESARLRVGTRLTHQLNEGNSLYGGIAYQCETKGEARATYRGNETAAPSVKGSSVLFELGWQVKSGKSPVSLDLGVNGWAGKQRGVSGKLGFKYNF